MCEYFSFQSRGESGSDDRDDFMQNTLPHCYFIEKKCHIKARLLFTHFLSNSNCYVSLIFLFLSNPNFELLMYKLHKGIQLYYL